MLLGGGTGGGASGVPLTAGENLSLGHLLTFDGSGDYVRASALFASNIWELAAVARTAATASNPVVGSVAGELIPILFGSAPAAAANGTLCFLSTTAGEATLTPPLGVGEVVFQVGVVQGADGVTVTPDVLFQPRYISRTP